MERIYLQLNGEPCWMADVPLYSVAQVVYGELSVGQYLACQTASNVAGVHGNRCPSPIRVAQIQVTTAALACGLLLETMLLRIASSCFEVIVGTRSPMGYTAMSMVSAEISSPTRSPRSSRSSMWSRITSVMLCRASSSVSPSV